MIARKPCVLSVGQCDSDHENIRRVLSDEFGADVERAGVADEAVRAVQAGRFDLVLVNRILDADGASGLDLIRRLQSDGATRATPLALVSNYPEAQDSAVALGAQRGFGKDALTSSETRDRLATLLQR